MRTLQVKQGSDFDSPPEVVGSITLDANGDMEFTDLTHAEMLSRFYRSTGGDVDRTDKQVFDLLYSSGGYSNGYVSVVPTA